MYINETSQYQYSEANIKQNSAWSLYKDTQSELVKDSVITWNAMREKVVSRAWMFDDWFIFNQYGKITIFYFISTMAK